MAALMSGFAETGLTTAKFVRRRLSDGAFWSTAGTPAFEAYNASHIANYGSAATEVGVTGVYTATDPAETAAGDYLLVKAAGASLAVSDVVNGLRWQDGVIAGSAMTLADGAITDAKFALPEASGVATGVLGMIQQLWRRFFKRATKDATTIKTYADDGTTVVTTQAYTSSGADDDVGAAT